MTTQNNVEKEVKIWVCKWILLSVAVHFHTLRQSYEGRMHWCTQTSHCVKLSNPSPLLNVKNIFMSCHFCYWSNLFNFVSTPWKVLLQCEPRLIKPVRKNGHKAEGLQGVCVCTSQSLLQREWLQQEQPGLDTEMMVVSSMGQSSLTGAAWNRFPEKLISCSCCSWLCLSLLVSVSLALKVWRYHAMKWVCAVIPVPVSGHRRLWNLIPLPH